MIKPALRTLTIDTSSDLTLSLQLQQQLIWLIATRQLKEGEKLPSVREFADHLGINLNTVRAAYKRLEADSLVTARRGVGTTVLRFTPLQLRANASNVRTFTIGVILPDFGSLFYLPFLKGIEETVKHEPSLLFVSTAQNSELKAKIEIDQLIAKGVDGLIVASQGEANNDNRRPADSSSSPPPVVYVDQPNQSGHVVLLDSEEAGYQATSHLIEHGHERIGIISPPLEWASVRECHLGYRRALQQASVEVDESLLATTPDFTIEAGFEAAHDLMKQGAAITAIYAVQDALAIGAMRAIKERGMQVPQDVAVVGYNDIELATLVDPPLTTVKAPARQLGIEAMSMLQRLIRGEEVTPRSVVLDTSLVVRRSCGFHSGEA